jgi:transketolase
MSAKSKQPSYLEGYKQVHVFEDHIIDGGFGSWILESAIQMGTEQFPRIELHGIDALKTIGQVGSSLYLESLGGLRGER